MKCAIDSKALSNFTPNPSRHFWPHCAKTVPNTFIELWLCQSPAASHWPRAFQNENVAVTGAAQPEENAFEPVLDEDQSEIHVALARQVRELLADGSGEVLWGRFGQLE
jgi:hypothetical protein